MRKVSIISATYAAKIQAFISTEETRYYLNGFLIEPHTVAGAYIVATDGHRMGIFHDADATVAQKDIIRLPKDFIKACKARSAYPLFVYVDHEKQAAYLAPALEEGASLPDDLSTLQACDAVALKVLVDGTFPDWERVCPAAPTDDQTRVTSFSAKHLGEFAAVADQRNAPITVYAKEPMAPAWVFVSRHPEFLGVLMPIRGADAKLPAWFQQKPTAAKQAAE